jgi:hypothetical protein
VLIFRCHQGIHINSPSNESSGIFDTLLSLVVGTRRPLPFLFFVFWLPTSRGVESIGSRPLGCAIFGFFACFLVFSQTSNVAQSTTKAECVTAASCCFQLLWITYTLSDFGEECSHVPLICDSTSAISVAKNRCFTPEPNI